MVTIEFDNKRMISLVRDRPILWDKSHTKYNCRNTKVMAWREVAILLNNGIDIPDEEEKQKFIRHVTKRWTNVKDSWWRYNRTENSVSRRTPYKYHKLLMFLLKNRESNGVTSTKQEPLSYSDDSSASDNFQEPEIIEYEVLSGEETKPARNEMASDSLECTLMEDPLEQNGLLIKNKNHKFETPQMEEDRHISFFRGILPTLHMLNEDEVLKFQIEVLKLLQVIKKPSQ